MVTRAKAKYVRISPLKVRQVITHVKGLPVERALAVLKSINKKGAVLIESVLKSAIANAKHKGFDQNGLFVSNVIANAGPSYKRYRSASFGRATVIRKRTSHITVELDSRQVSAA
jgi:large subunit ribosomal protein L22